MLPASPGTALSVSYLQFRTHRVGHLLKGGGVGFAEERACNVVLMEVLASIDNGNILHLPDYENYYNYQLPVTLYV